MVSHLLKASVRGWRFGALTFPTILMTPSVKGFSPASSPGTGQYDAATAERWGLVNRVVPMAQLREEVRSWADEMLAVSPTALKVFKHSFNADTEAIAGIGGMAFDSLELFVRTPEAKEGVKAFEEKRQPDFSRHR